MKIKKLSKAAFYVVGGLLAVYLAFQFLLPFLIAFALALIAEKPVVLLQEKGRLPRGFASFLCVLAVLCLIIAGVFFLCRLFCAEVLDFTKKLPAYAGAVSKPLISLKTRLLELADSLPDGLGTGFHAGVTALFESSAVIGKKVYEWLFAAASSLIETLPNLVFAVITGILASFMISAEMPDMKIAIKKMLPAEKRELAVHLYRHVCSTIGHWLKAEIKLAGIMFCVITAGLLVLSVQYPLLFGLIAAIIDALPVFGVGIVLVPWSILLFLQGNVKKAIGMLILFAVTSMLRQALEPRLIGKQMGVSPLIMLIAIYVGFQILGITGMLLFPILVVLVKSFVGENRLV